MVHHDTLSPEAKIKAFKALTAASRLDPAKALNELFFAARNGAIERVLRVLEQHFRDKGLTVTASWHETSMPGVAIYLELNDKRTGKHTRRLILERESMQPHHDHFSVLIYRLKEVVSGEYYGGRIPKVGEALSAVMQEPTFKVWTTQLVNGVNYPFTYESHTSF
jgi:hypothetical protein